MKYKNSLVFAISLICFGIVSAQTRYVGGDISLLPEYENAGAKYRDTDGSTINNLLPYLYDQGMNAMRVRLFVDPSAFAGNDPNACQDLPYILPLCQRIVENGFDLMLDFHYSDTWADPVAQWIPKAWEGLTDEELIEKIYEYTKDTLSTLRAAGVVPAFIQPGNEISYGMLWSPYGAPASEQHKTLSTSSDENWQRLGALLNSAIKACREECPEAKIIIHTERVAKIAVQTNFYNRMKTLGVDYDIIGLSYYPYFHGNMSVLNLALTSLESIFPEKDIMIVETGYSYKWEVPGTTEKVDYPYSAAGQDAFAKDLVETLLAHPKVIGLFWWWMEYNAYGTKLSGWYNAPLFDSQTGKATPALKTICTFGTGHSGIESVVVPSIETDIWHDLQGRRIQQPSRPGIYIHDGKKIAL